jgi:hypothetical protein
MLHSDRQFLRLGKSEKLMRRSIERSRSRSPSAPSAPEPGRIAFPAEGIPRADGLAEASRIACLLHPFAHDHHAFCSSRI